MISQIFLCQENHLDFDDGAHRVIGRMQVAFGDVY